MRGNFHERSRNFAEIRLRLVSNVKSFSHVEIHEKNINFDKTNPKNNYDIRFET